MVVFPVSSSKYAMVCFIQFTSSRSGVSSRACAPLLSVRRFAACMVAAALASRLRSSRVSIRSVFQIRLRSSVFTSLNFATTASIFVAPSASTSLVRYTAAWSCMVACISALSSAVLTVPSANRRWSKSWIVFAPASFGKLGIGSPGLAISAIRSAQALPKMTMSSRELAPSLLAPCTEAQPTSPAANRPGTTRSWSMISPLTGSFTCFTTSPKWLVGTPPML
mmetsp:Transcript_64484/g.120843  ORF Transcript_64484/g.120843 Transcript_64484/m.120843 type:complete len:223 (+) Transcript_64484:312-980(+)